MKTLFHNVSLHAYTFFTILFLFFIFVFFPSLKRVNTDFPNYYVSSNMLLDGKDLRTAYDNVEFNKQVKLYGIEDQFVSFVPYPPVNALLMIFLSRLKPLTAKLFWNIFNLIFFISSIYFISRISQLNFYLTGLLFFMSGYAFVNNFFFGQAYLLVLLFFSASIYFLLKGNDLLTALFFAMSVLLKFYTIFFLLLFLFSRKYRLFFLSISLIVFLNLLVMLATGIDVNYFYYSTIMPRISDGWIGLVYATEYQSVLSLLHRLFYSEPALNPHPLIESPQLYFIMKYVFYFALIILSVAASINSARNKESFNLLISLFCIVSMLMLPVNASYQYIILIPAIAILCRHYLLKNNYRMMIVCMILLFIMNSPVALYIINITKNQSYYFAGYIKLFILFYFFVLNWLTLRQSFSPQFTLHHKLRFSYVYVFLVLVFSQMSLALSKQANDNAVNIVVNQSYLNSMPSTTNTDPGKLIFTEGRGENFILNSNFGFTYEKENVFDPQFINENEIEFSTIKEKSLQVKELFVNTQRTETITTGTDNNKKDYSKDKTKRCYSKDGQIFLENVNDGKSIQLTSGDSFNTMPVFAGDDSKIIFCSDRNRGVGFTTLYEININR